MAIALSIAYTATPLAAGVKMIVEATPQMSAGINYAPRSLFKVIGVTAAAAASPYNALTPYNTKFGALISGQKIFFRLTPVSADGFKAASSLASVIVT